MYKVIDEMACTVQEVQGRKDAFQLAFNIQGVILDESGACIADYSGF